MKVLVINSGSSSLKYQLIDMTTEVALAKGVCERIGLDQSFIKHEKEGNDSVKLTLALPNHKVAIKEVLNVLTDSTNGVITSMDEIRAVGHRVVHGGEKFTSSVIINEDVMKTVQECAVIAPLHNPPNIIGIESCQQLMPTTPMVAVFDTAFHQTMPEVAYMYPIPYEIYVKYQVRKYGFHGTSHKYVANRAATLLAQPIEDLKIITCHLGNGSSICAVKNGHSVDTSMGFTPLEGLAMGTRSGNIDPAITTYLMDKEDLSTSQVNDLLNKKSGVLGISGVSSDFRDIECAAEEGNKRAQLALDMFEYRITKTIGEYAAAMNGVDAIVFTAGVGENSWQMRERIALSLTFLGIEIDKEKNKVRGKEVVFNGPNSKVKLLAIPTNEELAIARETVCLIK